MDIVSFAVKTTKIFDSYSGTSTVITRRTYGRGLEQASGLGLWFVSITLLLSGNYGVAEETLFINNSLLAWILFLIGCAQLQYSGLGQRAFLNVLSSVIWLTVAIYGYWIYGDLNLITAASLPYSLTCFYMFGFLSQGGSI